MNKIAILDFGSQYTHLIGTRVRRLGVFTEIMDPQTLSPEQARSYKGLIFAGGPASVYEKDAPSLDPALLNLGLPILGVCYGHQLITHLLGGKVEPGSGQGSEFGKAEIQIKNNQSLFMGFQKEEKTQVWMSHGDRITLLPPGFKVLASSTDDPYSAVGNLEKNIYGIQFHTEVLHTVKGNEILSNFLSLCGVKRDWDLGNFVEEAKDSIRAQAGQRNVFMLMSGGVDSTVAFALLVKILGPDRVYGLFVDTGFMRWGEREQVVTALQAEGIRNLHVYDASTEFLAALQGVLDPEKKRQIMGRVFLEIQAKVAKELGLNPEDWILGQGTIYPDTIESGGTKNSAKIKTHHNRVPEIEHLMQAGRLIEPLKDLYKDEVRSVGERLGLPTALVWRHPFPGPGLAVRILCAEKEDWVENRVDLEGRITAFLEEKGHALVAKTLPIKSVGVQGDFRTYRHPIVLSGPSSWEKLSTLAPQLTNRFKEINRVIYALTPQEIHSLSLTPGTLTPERVKRLQHADKLCNLWLKEIGKDREVWQMPIVLLPLSVNTPEMESIVLRPIVSEEAMTAHFAQLPMEKLSLLTKTLLEDHSLSAVFYDLTNKPPGTIEWE